MTSSTNPPMTAAEIRQSYLDFFASKQHEIVPSSPVVLPADPTLMFVNAGMNPFKEIFLGAREPTQTRVADTQKCIRVSGKQNDLEEVGVDTYHHTFFEMLGNWSFGDYYKAEAIEWAWELLTKVWKLPKERLWITVYRDDDEAMELWKSLTDIDPSHVLRFDEKDNFWEMGDTGPCGPCSEIHFDRTPNADATPEMVNADLVEVVEVWNLVFIQNNRREDGSLEELPSKHIDTGMGFERIVAVIQGHDSNYDSELFMPLINWLKERSGRAYEGDDAVAMRVIADHIRTLTIAIGDGISPGAKGRKYVLRRLLRRAANYARKLGLNEPFMHEMVPVVQDILGSIFPSIMERDEAIRRDIKNEEVSFQKNLQRGVAVFEKLVSNMDAGNTVISGEESFDLYSTYGFPVDLTCLMAAERGLTVDEAGFEESLNAEQEANRSMQKAKLNDNAADLIADLVAQGIQSSFTGYDSTSGETEVLAVFDDELVLLKETPFYAESGGQLGDTGSISCESGTFTVSDTQRPAEGIILHIGEFDAGRFDVGESVTTQVDTQRRRNLERHHSATHIMNHALREAVSDEIRQAGSMVAPDRLRFDFSYHEAVPSDKLEEIERMVNRFIMENGAIETNEIPIKEVEGSDIIAVFDEKYGELVRVVDIGGYSKELCGGTHVDSAGEIGGFRIVQETSVSAGVRRIEAVCATAAVELTTKQNRILNDLARSLSVTPDGVMGRVQALLTSNRDLERKLKQQAAKSALSSVDDLLGQVVEHNGYQLLAARIEGQGPDGLRQIMDALRPKITRGVIVLGGDADGKASFVANVSKDLVGEGLHAGKLIGQVAKLAGGGGGGQPEKAQAGGKDPSKVADAVAAVPGFLA